MSTLFRVSSLPILPFWALMILAPRWHWTQRVMRSMLMIVAPAALYVTLVLPHVGEIWPAVARPTLAGIATLLGTPTGATIAWVHFLAFDLFVGRWIYLDSRKRGLNPWLISPVLYFTLMLGPAGFLSYLIVRAAVRSEADASTREDAPLADAGTLPARAANSLRTWMANLWATNRPLTVCGVLMLLAFAATLVGIVVDHRVITGAPAWVKPAKFAISIAIYCFTLVWLLGFVRNRPRLVRLVANVTIIGVMVEMAAIVTQAARGRTSHFNLSTTFDASLWLIMGTFILLVWAANLLLAIMLMMQRIPDRALALSLRLGVLISSVGMAVAFLMTAPTAAQRESIAHGGARIAGAHSVGVADGGPGLPFLGWSTVGGDLRVPHFAGLHALQLIPFLGWMLTRRWRGLSRLSEGQRVALVWTGGLSYLGIVMLLVWQALRGQSLIHPDAKTLAAAGLLAFGTAISVLVTIAPAWRKKRSFPEQVPARQEKILAGANMKSMTVVSILAVLMLSGVCLGQNTKREAASLPDSPSAAVAIPDTGSQPVTTAPSPTPAPPAQTNSFTFGVGDKLGYYVVETYFNPATFIGPAIQAGARMANPPGKDPTRYPPEWRQGPEAFGRNYGDALAQRLSFRTARFVTGVITRENPNYIPSQSHNVLGRSLHAFSYTFIDRSDSGECRLAISNFAGAAAAGFVGNAYLPAGFTNASHAGQRAVFQLGMFAAGNLFREFAPQIPGPIRTFFTLIAR